MAANGSSGIPATAGDARVSGRPSGPLRGEATAPGDKSISHRALIFGALADGETSVHGLLEGEDVLRTAAAMRALGARVERDGRGAGAAWRIEGAPWKSPERPLYFGNSGTGARLVMGAVAGQGVAASFDGDASLRRRPMGRILDPLRLMGAEATARDGRLPVAIEGGKRLKGIDYALPTPSAQIKSAVLLAGLGADGETIVREPVPCRDHTERMLAAFGAGVRREAEGDGFVTRLAGGARLKGTSVQVPGDPSSAAFLVVAGLIVPGSEVTIRNVLMNPSRVGLFDTLREMGGAISVENGREQSGEPVADLCVRESSLRGVTVPAARAPSMIDEYPVLAVAAAFADGETRMEGIAELRVKESDRIDAVEAGLAACGVASESGEDWLSVRGAGRPKGGGLVETCDDHRIAMSFLVMGLAAQEAVAIDDAAMIGTSFPGFVETIAALGGDIGPV